MVDQLQSQLQHRPQDWLGHQNLSQRNRTMWGGGCKELHREVTVLGSEDKVETGKFEPLGWVSHIKGRNLGLLEYQHRG